MVRGRVGCQAHAFGSNGLQPRDQSVPSQQGPDGATSLCALLGPVGIRWLGFTGSGLLAIVAGVAGSSLAFRFSWGNVAERLGASLYAWIESSRKKREVVQDIALGQQAAREREVVVSGERIEIEEHHPAPMVVEPVVLEVPRSERSG